MESKLIDTARFSEKLRQKGIDINNKKILITNFESSQQSEDLTLPPNCQGFGRIHHFKRSMGDGFPSNPLPIDPATHYLRLPESNLIQVQVFQNAICSWRCWYCFVDFSLLSGDPKHSQFKSAVELLDLYLKEDIQTPIIDLSGGQPDLVPEWTLWIADEIHRRGLQNKIYLWSDDNLSNSYLWKYLTNEEVARLAGYKNYGRVGCFKGYDTESFSFNTLAEPHLFNLQFKLMRKLVDANFDVYGYVTLTSPTDNNIHLKMRIFMDRLQEEVHELFPLRTVPLRIFEFTPTKGRMNENHKKALEVQKTATEVWQSELLKRFSREQLSKRIFEHSMS